MRGRAVEVFASLAKDICMLGEYNRNLAKNLLYPSLPPFIRAMLECLAEKVSSLYISFLCHCLFSFFAVQNSMLF